MTLAHRFNLLLYLCVLVSTMAFCTADAKPLLGLLAVAGTVACYVFSRGARAEHPPMLPRLAINLLVFAAIVNAALRASGNTLNEDFVSTLGQFLVFVLLIKLLDRRAPRDDAQIITLTIFIAVASVLTSGSLPVGVLLIVFVPGVVATAMLWQIRAGQVMMAADARSNAALAGTDAVASFVPPIIAAGRHPRRAFIGVCLCSVVAACAIATAVFVLVPRGIGSDICGRFGMTPQPQIGFREAVRLGEAGFLSENPTPVMDVQFTTAGGESLGGMGETIYLRGAARDEYDPELRVWEDPSAGQIDNAGQTTIVKLQEGYEYLIKLRGMIPQEPEAGSPMSTVARRVQRITVRAESGSGTMFCTWRPLNVTPDRNFDAHISPRNGTMRHTSNVGQHFTYTITSAITDEVGWPPRPPRGFRTGRIHDTTSEMLAKHGLGADATKVSSRQVATAIRDHLRMSYGYTLEMVAPPEGVDPIEFFLFDRKKGHCEYFASAMAAMCQSQGIPCRVITGYVATEYNTLTGQYLVRESNAHAWVETFITTEPESGNGRWETFDASPPGDIERIHRPAGGALASLRSWYDALEFGWSTSVIGYDNASNQRSRASHFGDESVYTSWFVGRADGVAAWLKTVRADPTLIPWWVRYSPIVLLVMVSIWVAFRRKLTVWVSSHIHIDTHDSFGISRFRPTGFYARTLRVLARAGVPKPDQTPPALFADSIVGRSPEAATHLRSIAAALYRVHFGGRTLSAAETAAAQEQVRQLENALKNSAPRAG